jgi:hypothetical protein
MTGFAALETRVNAAVVGRLANATATIVEPSDVVGETFTGIFDAAYQVIDQATGIPSSAPVLTAQVSDFPDSVVDALEEGDTVSFNIAGVTYAVVEPQPDGTGMTTLRLRKI